MSKYNEQCPVNFTTTDCTFMNDIVTKYEKISGEADIESKIRGDDCILDVIKGNALQYGKPWSMVEYVFFPIWLPEQEHWLLGILSLSKRQMFVFNSLTCQGFVQIIRTAVLPLANLLPHYLKLTDFYSRTDINFTIDLYSEYSKDDPIKTVLKNKYPRAASK